MINGVHLFPFTLLPHIFWLKLFVQTIKENTFSTEYNWVDAFGWFVGIGMEFNAAFAINQQHINSMYELLSAKQHEFHFKMDSNECQKRFFNFICVSLKWNFAALLFEWCVQVVVETKKRKKKTNDRQIWWLLPSMNSFAGEPWTLSSSVSSTPSWWSFLAS